MAAPDVATRLPAGPDPSAVQLVDVAHAVLRLALPPRATDEDHEPDDEMIEAVLNLSAALSVERGRAEVMMGFHESVIDALGAGGPTYSLEDIRKFLSGFEVNAETRAYRRKLANLGRRMLEALAPRAPRPSFALPLRHLAARVAELEAINVRTAELADDAVSLLVLREGEAAEREGLAESGTVPHAEVAARLGA